MVAITDFLGGKRVIENVELSGTVDVMYLKGVVLQLSFSRNILVINCPTRAFAPS